MDLSQLRALVEQGESETLEFKKTTGERREAMQSLCGMLNHRGGYVLFGVEPGGNIQGQQLGERTVEELAQEIQQIEPKIFPQIDPIVIRSGVRVIAVMVTTGPNRPYSYKGQAYKRVGSSCLKMSRDEYNRMLFERFHGERRWETEQADGWTVRDLDVAELIRTIDEAIRRGRMADPLTRDPVEILRGFGLMRGDNLLRAAAVLFGEQARLEAELPQCLLRAARFKGTDKSEFLDSQQFHGNAFQLLHRAERFLRDNLPIAGRVVPNLFARQDDPLYPIGALREALANAFCHRDYSIGGGSVAASVYQNRLEITSSGSLHFGLTAASLYEPHESLQWNPLIARVFYRRGLVESWGGGTLLIARLTEKAGLPRPVIEENSGCVVVRFFPNRYVPPETVAHSISARQQQILQLLSHRGRLAVREIAVGLGIESRPIREELGLMKQLGLVDNEGFGRGSFWFLVGQ